MFVWSDRIGKILANPIFVLWKDKYKPKTYKYHH